MRKKFAFKLIRAFPFVFWPKPGIILDYFTTIFSSLVRTVHGISTRANNTLSSTHVRIHNCTNKNNPLLFSCSASLRKSSWRDSETMENFFSNHLQTCDAHRKYSPCLSPSLYFNIYLCSNKRFKLFLESFNNYWTATLDVVVRSGRKSSFQFRLLMLNFMNEITSKQYCQWNTSPFVSLCCCVDFA